jgi:hypothetical protein
VKKQKVALNGVPEWDGHPVALTADQQDVLRRALDMATRLLEVCETVDEEKQRANLEALRRALGGQAGRTTTRPGPNVPRAEGPSAGGDS